MDNGQETKKAILKTKQGVLRKFKGTFAVFINANANEDTARMAYIVSSTPKRENYMTVREIQMSNNQKRFPTSLLKDGDPNNYLVRAIRKLELRKKERKCKER